jgi:flagellar biosynthesis/type III secretory pathway M-ring protein FliF/YscJ
MVLLGIILLLLGVAVGVVSIIAAQSATGLVHVAAFGFQRDAHAIELFVAGAVAVLLFCIGWAILAARARRRARIRRDEREQERIADVERAAEAERTEHERRLEEGGLRNEDLQRREDELVERENAADAREQEVARLEAAYREKVGPSRADVVTGRAQGNVAEGTAHWVDDGTDNPDAPRRQ